MKLLLGICSLGWCLASAARAADPCPLTDACVKDGQCTLVGGRCAIATEADCLQSRGCVDAGECTLVPGPTGAMTCEGTACDKTAACKAFGMCTTRDGECRPTAESCVTSAVCKTYGACDVHYSGTLCAGASDCAERLNCKRSGACEAWESDAPGSDGLDGATCVEQSRVHRQR